MNEALVIYTPDMVLFKTYVNCICVFSGEASTS